MSSLPPIPQNPISECFIWRDWFSKIPSAIVSQTPPGQSIFVENFYFTNTTTDYQAITAAIAYALSLGGGTVYFGKQNYTVNTTITITPPIGGKFNLVLQGTGKGGTTLNFSTAVGGSDGIVITSGLRIAIENLTIKNAPSIGININKGSSIGGNGVSRIAIRDVIVDGSGSHGIYFLQTYVGYFENIECRNSGGYGLLLAGYHDALTFVNCWCGGDATAPNGGNNGGWFINDVKYSSFIGCASDWASATPGWTIRNNQSVNYINCGSESNYQEGFLVQTGTTGGETTTNVVFDGCFGHYNSKQTMNGYADFLGVSTSNSITANIIIKNCTDTAGSNPGSGNFSNVSFVMNGTSGTINTDETLNAVLGSTSVSGTVYRKNSNLSGASLLADLITTPQTLTTGVLTQINLNNIQKNWMGGTLSSNSIIIPAGVNRVRVVGQISWDTNSTGSRYGVIYQNGSITKGMPQQKSGASDLFMMTNLVSAVVEVAVGDVFTLWGTQNSGGNLNVLNGSTFLSVEVVG